MALDYEVDRQVSLVESGGHVVQETRLYNAGSGETVSMRSKEHAHDYRYFPEPDLIPLSIGAEWLDRVLATMPELPAARRGRFIESSGPKSYGLNEYDAQVLTATREIGDYFEKAAAVSGDPKTTANWVMGDLAGLLKPAGKEISESPISPEHLGDLVKLINSGQLSGKLAKEIFPRMFETGDSPSAIMDREGLRQISDSGALEKIVDEIISTNTKQVDQYKSGKTSVMGFFVGQVMKASRGQANPAAVNEILRNKLN
jgi:aspartyl-tRNA(Asn)/glutamyl-tRNA(Gln) amidotransferase subunit B